MQIKEYKTIKKNLADHISEIFDGSVFERTIRISERISPKDTEAIQKLSGDAVLMGNIKELVSTAARGGHGLTAIQVEIKLIDVKTGEEVKGP